MLREELEKADGKASWTAVAKRAFPEGKFSKSDCVEVRYNSLCRCLIGADLYRPFSPFSPYLFIFCTASLSTLSFLYSLSISLDYPLQRWKHLSKPQSQKGPWTASEDALLNALVAKYGCEKWVSLSFVFRFYLPSFIVELTLGRRHRTLDQVLIANELVSRSGKQCRERWHNHLDPSSTSSLRSLRSRFAHSHVTPPYSQQERMDP